jgi:hypothetical protein
MNRTVLGAFGALLLAAAGLFWWQGRAVIPPGKLPQLALAGPTDPALPNADGKGLQGPALPEVDEATKEQRRFDRLDRNRDARVTREEMLSPRVAMFRKLDVDGNNLLTFDEWSVKTSTRFKGADGNGDGNLDRAEFAKTKPKPKLHPECKCNATPRKPGAKPQPPQQQQPSDEDGEPAE